MNQYMPQMPQQPYGQPYQQSYAPDLRMQDYVARMRQQLDDFERRYSQPQQLMQQPVQQTIQAPQMAQATGNDLLMLVVASMDEAQNHPPDITGKKQWFINKDTDEIYSKQFNVKTAGLEFNRYGVIDAPEEPKTASENGAKANTGQMSQGDTIKALEAKIDGLERKQKELEARLNESTANDGKSDANASTENATGVSAANADGKRGAKPKSNNRLGATEKTPTGTDAVRADS